MVTQPAVHQDSVPYSETIACMPTTTCPDLFATSTAGGLVVLWNISGTLKVVLFILLSSYIKFNVRFFIFAA
jgi:hypothetical protein